MANPRRNVQVEYIKGKYQYKKTFSRLKDQSTIYYSGPIEPMAPVFGQILGLMRRHLQEDLLSNTSRKSLRELQDRMQDPTNTFIKKGITHIIIYEAWNQ